MYGIRLSGRPPFSELVAAPISILWQARFRELNAGTMIVKPTLCLLVAIGILYAAAPSLETLRPALPAEFLFIVVKALILCVLYGGGLLLRIGRIKMHEFR